MNTPLPGHVGILVGMALPVAGILVWILIWAWRGKRMDDHPLCRKCGFDLTGRPEGSIQCSECGADLTLPRAIKVGHYKRRVGWVLGVGVALLALLLAGATGVVLVFGQIDIMPYKPTSWLVTDLSSPVQRTRADTLRELYARIDATTQLHSSILAGVDRILKIQGDPNATWQGEMGDFVEHVIAAGQLDDARKKIYARQSVKFVLTARPSVRHGEQFVFRTSTVGLTGSQSRIWVQYDHELRFEGSPLNTLSVGNSSGSSVSIGNTGWSEGSIYCPTANLAKVPIRLVEVDVVTKYKVYENSQALNNSVPPLFEGTSTSKHTVEVMPSDANDIKVYKYDGLDKQVRDSILSIKITRSSTYLNASVGLSQMPEDLAIKMIMMYDDKKIEMGTMTLEKGRKTTYGLGCRIPLDLPPKVDIRIEPAPSAVRNTVYLKGYADVELLYKDVDTGAPPSAPSTSPTPTSTTMSGPQKR